MEPFTTLTGIVAPLDRVDVDTDQITNGARSNSLSK